MIFVELWVLDEYEPLFVKGAIAKGIPEYDAKSLWDDLIGFADYCLHGSTKILTKEYGYIPIVKIVENKMRVTVFSLSKDGNIIEQPIEQFWNKGYCECYSYKLENGKEVICTKDHQFKTEKGMIPIEEIFANKIPLITKRRKDG